MNKISFQFIFLIISILWSCNNNSAQNTSDNSENAFAKIDLKNSNSFTKEERRKAYNNSLNSISNKKALLKNNVTYNGYGASIKQKKKPLK